MPFDIRHLLVYLCATLLAVAPGLAWVNNTDKCPLLAKGGNLKSAYSEYKQMAEQGGADAVDAQFCLGVMHHEGKGVIGDPQEAYFWLLLAAYGGNKNALKLKEEVRKHLTSDQISAATGEAKFQVSKFGVIIQDIWTIDILTTMATALILCIGIAIMGRYASTTTKQASCYAISYTIFVFFVGKSLHFIGWLPTTDDFLQFSAVLIGPVLAVIVGIVLHNNWTKEERQHKVLNTLMATREYDFSHERVQALNVVNLEFKNPKVVKAWEAYVEHMNNNSEQGEEGSEKYDILLSKIAAKLGYKGMHRNNIERYSYAPPAHRNLELIDANLKTSLLKVLAGEEPLAVRDSKRETAEALYIQGERFRYGEGVRENKEKATRLFRNAIILDCAKAKNALGEMYLNGEDIRKNNEKAAFWFKNAIKQNLAEAKNNLGVMHYNGKISLQNGEKRAKIFLEEAAKKGFAAAQYNLALMHVKTDHTGQIDEKAKKLFEKAADQKFSDAEYSLGIWHEKGNFEDLKDDAYDYLHRATAAEKSENDKVLTVGKGDITIIDVRKENIKKIVLGESDSGDEARDQKNKEALGFYRDAAMQGHTKARDKLEKFANMNNVTVQYAAQYYLGVIYANGKGVDRDMLNAYAWLILAAHSGHEQIKKIKDKIAKKLTDVQIYTAEKKAECRKNKIEENDFMPRTPHDT